MKICHLLLVAALASAVAQADDDNTTTLKFSDPSKPGRLRAVVSNGELRIRGADTDSVTIRTLENLQETSKPRADGLRVIATAAQFTATEENNVITLDHGAFGWSHDGKFDITVPRNTSVQLQNNFGGEVIVEDLAGDVEIKNMNGEIKLRGLGGGALVETMNGEIDANFAALPSDKPIAFSSMNGAIRLRVPADAKANVRFRTQNGSILTDFGAEALVTKTEPNSGATYGPMAADIARAATDATREAMQIAVAVATEVSTSIREERRGISLNDKKNDNRSDAASRPPKPPRAPRAPAIPAMAGGKVVSGTLNGGGATEIQIATMNGDIVVRKLNE
jgi:hypothetical protein